MPAQTGFREKRFVREVTQWFAWFGYIPRVEGALRTVWYFGFNKLVKLYQIGGSHSGADGDSNLLGSYAVSTGSYRCAEGS